MQICIYGTVLKGKHIKQTVLLIVTSKPSWLIHILIDHLQKTMQEDKTLFRLCALILHDILRYTGAKWFQKYTKGTTQKEPLCYKWVILRQMKTNAFCRYLHTEKLVHFTVIVLKGSTEFPKRLRLFESVHDQVREIVTQKLTVTEKSKNNCHLIECTWILALVVNL